VLFQFLVQKNASKNERENYIKSNTIYMMIMIVDESPTKLYIDITTKYINQRLR